MNSIKNAILLVSLSLSVFLSGAQAGTFPIAGMSVNHLPANQDLHVFYVDGSSLIGMPGANPVVSSVYLGPVTVKIDSNGEAVIPPAQTPRNGLHVANYIVLVVTSPDQREVYIRNADKSVISDLQNNMTNPKALSESYFANKGIKYVSVADAQKSPSIVMSIDFMGSLTQN